MNVQTFHFVRCLFVAFLFFTLILAAKIPNSTHNHIVKVHQPRQLDFFKWLFGGVRKSNRNSTEPIKPTLFTPFLANTSSSPTSTFTTTKSKNPSPVVLNLLAHLSSNLTGHSNSSINLSANEREGKQLLPGNPYYPYQIYAWPWNTFQSPFMQPPYNFHNQRHRLRPVYNVYAENEQNNKFGIDDGNDYDANSEFEMTLNELKEEHHRNQLHRISIEVEPYTSNEESESDSMKNDGIEDYDLSSSKAPDSVEDLKYLPTRNKYRNIFARSIGKSINSQETACTGPECSLHVFDQRRPVSRGKTGSVVSHDQFSNVDVLSPYSMEENTTSSTSFPDTTTLQTTGILVSNTSSPANTTNSSVTNTASTTPITPAFGEGSSSEGTATFAPSTNITANMHPVATPSSMTSSNETFNSTITDTSTTSTGASVNGTNGNFNNTDFTTSSTESSNSVSVASSITPSPFPNLVSENNTTMTTDEISTEGITVKPPPSISAILNCQCGVQSISTQNIGSTVARVPAHPWIVEILSKSKHLCAGSIINNNYILTSANCVEMLGKGNLRVVAGLQLRNPKTFSVSKVAIHPKFDPLTLSNDLALLRLSERIKPSREIRPVCLPLQTQTQPYKTAHLITWLRVGKQGKSLQLLQTEVELLNSTTCQNIINSSARSDVQLSNGTFCAMPPGQKKCSGDVGGILQVYAGKFSYEQIGIVSRTVGCRTAEIPGIYTDVRHYLRWILFQTQDAHYCREPISGNFANNYINHEQNN